MFIALEVQVPMSAKTLSAATILIHSAQMAFLTTWLKSPIES